jgi:plastocyanin
MSPRWLLAQLHAWHRFARGTHIIPAALAIVSAAALVAAWALPLPPGGEAPRSDGRALAAPAAASQTVQVGDNFFNPSSASLNVGDTVTWTWVGFGSHSTTSGTCVSFSCTPDGRWDSGVRFGGPDFSPSPNPFTVPGTYPYYCSVHGAAMSGQVVVSGGGGATATSTPTATRTPTPTATPLVTSTPTNTPVACAVRPPVLVVVAPSGPNRLQVTVTAGTGGGNAANVLKTLQFGGATNAVIDWSTPNVPNAPNNSPGTVSVTLPGATQQATFFVRRVGSGTAGTVPFTVMDNCGDWLTFVGAGPGGWPPEPPPPAPSARMAPEPPAPSGTLGSTASRVAPPAPPASAPAAVAAPPPPASLPAAVAAPPAALHPPAAPASAAASLNGASAPLGPWGGPAPAPLSPGALGSGPPGGAPWPAPTPWRPLAPMPYPLLPAFVAPWSPPRPGAPPPVWWPPAADPLQEPAPPE